MNNTKIKLTRDLVYLMSFIHTKQLREWLLLLLQVKNPKLLFKYNINNAYKAVVNLDVYLNSNKNNTDDYEEEYEISAEVSDAIMDIAKFDEEDRNQIYILISKIKSSNYDKNNLY